MNRPLHADPSVIDSRQAAWRLLVALGLVVLGNSSMYVVSVVLPTVQTEFGIDRASASLPYTFMMVCLGIGGIWTGRMADRHGLMKVLWVGALAVAGGFLWGILVLFATVTLHRRAQKALPANGQLRLPVAVRSWSRRSDTRSR